MSNIPELSLLEDIENLSNQYAKEFGEAPINLSTWDPSPTLLNGLAPTPPRTRPGVSWIDYSFSYELAERPELVERFGYDVQRSGCLVTHSGSTAIISVVSWLKSLGHKRVLILAPRYFSVPHALTALGIDHSLLHLRRTSAGYALPAIPGRLLQDHDALWITNPVYCTSVDFDRWDKTQLAELAQGSGLTFVVDECLAEPGRYLGPDLAKCGTVVAMYAPHKAICVNGLKFGAVVFPEKHQRHFDSWSDVWNGCLPASSVLAVRHFLSPDFDRYRREFKQQIDLAHHRLRAAIDNFTNLTVDPCAEGYLVSVYAPRIAHDKGTNLRFLKQAIWQSGATFIAGIRNELDPEAGLSFRINLSALDPAAMGALARLCSWLDDQEGDLG